ncbi:Myb-like DNA-binding domain protein (macronuclear) [Tetrahymena thermophila SB210]|uniref:Myb-like DNA-binding domain protein n=1 Tax=Tetrahymena thermophila (strain SB210) TaxID=312017 RepID=Q231I4_TETTS|nr:Myb-like DNA-binding domain protein [Tetrahymena thermophila SB210]EAR91055.3 Myb-like DNA-binding domain protein [Tetrahymena thermophila SB210]|eukprot:XP_001011300.3 Myb-like DNA-binding domain protein [Tetrahymena thermophila SB210]
MEQSNNYAQSPADKSESIQMPLASEQAYINFQQFLTDLSDIERETKLEEKYLKDNFRLKEIHSTLELNVVENIYNTILQKNRQMTDKRMKKNWTDDETSLLLWIVRVISERKEQDPDKFSEETWMEIAKMIPFKAFENCKLRWLYLKKNSVQCTPWTEEEDQKLKEIIQKKGTNSNKWNEIAKDLYNSSASKTFRKGKQCRERWNNHLDPDMKRGQWTDEEDLHLLQLSYENGSKWSYIAKQLKERTENAVKNRYKSLLRKEEKENKVQSQQSLISLSQCSLEIISSSSSTQIILTPTFAQSMKSPPTSPEQNKIFNIIIKLMNKISFDCMNPQSASSQNRQQDERIEEEDSEDECDDQNDNDEDQDGESHSSKSNSKNQNKKKNTSQKQSLKEEKEEKILQQQRKSSNDTEMQIETKNENTPTAANTECNTTELHLSDNKVTTQSTIFTPSSSPNRAFSHTKNDDENNINKQQVYHTSIFGQKNDGESYVNQDDVTTANNICQNKTKKAEQKTKKPVKQSRKKKQDAESNGNDECKKGSVSTFSDALMFQPILSNSRSSSPSLANNNNGEASCKNAKKKRQQKLEKNDTLSLTTASTATNRDSTFNSKKINSFIQRNSIKSCSTPIGSNSGFNPYYSSNAAPSPSTMLMNQLSSFHIHSTENTPSSTNTKRRNTYSTTDFQSAAYLEKRRYVNKLADDESENSQEEERGQRTKKIIVLAGNGNKIYGEFSQNIATIEESDETNIKKMEIEQDSMSQNQIIGLNLQQQNLLHSSSSEENMVNNENLNNINIIKKTCSSQSNSNNLKFSGNNSAFKQFGSSPLQGSIFKPQQTIQLHSQLSPLSNSSIIQETMNNSPLNSELLIQKLSQSNFSSLCSPQAKQQPNLVANLASQIPLTSKPESFQNKGFQKNKNFKQPSLFQPTNPQMILTNNQQ